MSEEDIKILESIVKVNKDFLQDVEKQSINQREIQALENILSEREQDKKKIKELEEENLQLEATKDEAIRRYNFESIPAQKVKDLIENKSINISGFECIAVEDLEELLEDK